MGSGQTNLPTTSCIPPIIPMVGSSSQHRASNSTAEPTMCGQVWHRPSKHLRSQSGPMAGVAFSAVPSSPPTRFAPQLFRVLLLHRLWLPFPLASRTCRCGQPLDPRGHHRAACSRAGVLGSRGFSVESAAARVCREAGARVSTNLLVRDLDLLVAPDDA